MKKSKIIIAILLLLVIAGVFGIYSSVSDRNEGKEILLKCASAELPAEDINKNEYERLLKINKNTERLIILKNANENEYRLEYNKRIIDIRQYLYAGDLEYHTVIGLKRGKTTVKAYNSKTDEFIGSFTVKVGDFNAEIKEEYKNTTILFNKHIDSCTLENGYLDLNKAIDNYRSDAVYTVAATDPAFIGTQSISAEEFYADSSSKFDRVFSKKTGTTTLKIYEKRGKKAKKKIGTINLTIKKAKDSEVYNSYRELDNDGIFYENFMSPGDSFDLTSAVVERYINPGDKKYHFKEDEYTFTAKSNRPDIVSVDENGICRCKKLYYANDKGEAPKITYTVKFKDGSEATGGGSFDLVDKDFFE